MGPSHRFTPHTGEVEVQIAADSLADVYAEALRALAHLMLGEPHQDGREDVRRKVVVRAPDREALLAAWLDELIFRSETEKAVFTAATIERVTDREIAAEIAGVREPVLATAVKAATLHRISVTEAATTGTTPATASRGAGRFSARVVLDV